MSPELATVLPAGPAQLSILSLFLKADPVVKGVLALLLLASVVLWAIILDRTVRLARFRREAAAFESIVRRGGVERQPALPAGAAGGLLEAALREWRDQDDAVPESRAERRERIERAMRAQAGAEIRSLRRGLPFLATVGASAPFIGLFGTVWGIMNSFQAIAHSQDTSLAVVAPGIAEALFATAMGLAAAIPAVIGYNKLTSALSNVAAQLSAAIGALGGQLARKPAPAAARPQKAAE